MMRWLLLMGAILPALAADAELRGVWVDRTTLRSRDTIRTMLERLDDGNFNAVLINVWSRGYPLWPSDVFERETGLRIDPDFQDRDVLAEVIEEAAPRGIAVIPWVEYGFVGGWSGHHPGQGRCGPIFDKHPEWLAKTRAGEVRFPISSGYYCWLAHANPEAQSFLIDLMVELARKYKTPAIEFDRARYPQLDCGYDDVTRALYAESNEGEPPPDNPADRKWVRWRADNLNAFLARLKQRVQEADWRMLINNAPITTPYGYETFVQDYPAWVREKAVDFITPQIYRSTAEQYLPELERQLRAVPGDRLVPGIDITNSKSPDVLARMIEMGRERKLPGFIVWYYESLAQLNAFGRLKETVLTEKAPLPWR